MNCYKHPEIKKAIIDGARIQALDTDTHGQWYTIGSDSVLQGEYDHYDLRIDPCCSYARKLVGYGMIPYDHWLAGGQLEVKSLDGEWIDNYDTTLDIRDCLVTKFLSIYKKWDGNVRPKKEPEVMWVCDTLYWDHETQRTFLPYTYIPQSKNAIELSDISDYQDCNKMIEEQWHKVPTKIR